MRRVLVLSCLLLASCVSYRPQLAGPQPGLTARHFSAVRSAWTREDTGYQAMVANAVVRATYKSADYRAVYVRYVANQLRMTGVDRAKLETKERIEASKYHTFFVALSTNQVKWNNLERDNSIWYIQLIGESGRRVKAVKIEKLDEDNPYYNAAVFSYVTPYSLVYKVHFPKRTSGGDVIGANTAAFTMHIRSVVATLKLTWKMR